MLSATARLAMIVGYAAAATPADLRVDWQGSPALGVGVGGPSPAAPLLFGWSVPSCPAVAGAMQTGFRIVVLHDTGGAGTVWDSGDVRGNVSVAVRYGGPTLAPGTAYRWRVTTTMSTTTTSATTTGGGGGGCTSKPSAEAVFITACDWHASSASWIGLGNESSTFNLVRRVVPVPARNRVRRMIAFVSAQVSGCPACYQAGAGQATAGGHAGVHV